MSKFLSEKFKSLEAYVPGEQPKDRRYIKLNTNESPFPPSESVMRAVEGELDSLQLYSDPECTSLVREMARVYGVDESCIVMNNGSDETLNFAFMAFCDKEHGAIFPDITYGFYSVFAELHGIPYEQIPLTDSFEVNYRDYVGKGKTVFIANPNAPTGIALPLSEIEEIVKSNPDNVVVIDEAYVDFGAESAVKLTKKYNNLLVVGTFSKSRSLAGARLGFGIASSEIIEDLSKIRYSTNPYNVNRMTMAAGCAALRDNSYYMDNCKVIAENRSYTQEQLKALGFTFTDSLANFVFARSEKISGEELYTELKSRGILVRHFSKARIKEYNRITVGTLEEMKALISAIKDIFKEKRI